MASTWKQEIGLLFNTEGYKPTTFQYIAFGLLTLVLIGMVALMAVTLETVRADYSAFLNKKQIENSPPITVPVPSLSAKQATVYSYQQRGFRFHSNIAESGETNSVELWSAPDAVLDEMHLYRRSGALIYEDGTATQFSIAVLYADNVWKLGSETQVEKRHFRQPTAIRSALNRPAVEQLAKTNDYIVGIGLASSKPTSVAERNEALAHARARNIGFSIYKLGFAPNERIRSVSFGQAKQMPQVEEFEPRQRSVILIGVNASRDVNLASILSSAARLITLEGVDLSAYSRNTNNVVLVEDFSKMRDYVKASDIKLVSGDANYLTLPSVPQPD